MKAAVCIGVLHQNCLDSQRDGRKILISEDRLSHPKNREGLKVIAVINYVLYNLGPNIVYFIDRRSPSRH